MKRKSLRNTKKSWNTKHWKYLLDHSLSRFLPHAHYCSYNLQEYKNKMQVFILLFPVATTTSKSSFDIKICAKLLFGMTLVLSRWETMGKMRRCIALYHSWFIFQSTLPCIGRRIALNLIWNDGKHNTLNNFGLGDFYFCSQVSNIIFPLVYAKCLEVQVRKFGIFQNILYFSCVLTLM